MKADKTIERGKEFAFKGHFFHKGVNGRWRDVLTQADCEEYNKVALAELGPECAHWLATGQMPLKAKL